VEKPIILCVDDEKIILDSLKAQLKKRFGNDYLYETAENADDAMELITELSEEGYSILVVVSDWLMPGVKGDDFLIDLHQQHPGIVKLMLTGQADEDAIEKAKDHANLHRCIYKPWAEEELVEAIETGVAKL
jgi:DNA-binding NtrC family response regulator